MIFGGFKKVNVKDCEYKFDDFKKATFISQGFYADGEKLVCAPILSETGDLKSGLVCVKVYDVGFTLYYCSDGKLYREKDGDLKAYGIPALSAPPDVFTCLYDGKNTVVAVCKTGAYLLNDTISFVSLPKGNAYTVFKGELFIAKGNKIIVCGEAAYTGDKITVDPKTFLCPSGSYGAALGFATVGDELYAIMKRGAVKITLTGGDMGYTIIDCGLPPFKIIDGTFKGMGNEIYFVGVNGLNRFNGKRVIKTASAMDNVICEPCGEAQASDNYYLLPVMVNGERKIYCMDVISGKDCFIGGDALLAGGKTISPTTGKIGEIRVTNGSRIWESDLIDFGISGKKTLYELQVDCDGEVTVSVCGDGVIRSFVIGGQKPDARPVILAEKFRFRLTTGENALDDVRSFKVKYRI